jgi:ferrous iron transport protein B
MTLQLRDLGKPMIVVVNKMDALTRARQTLDIKALESTLGCPVFALSANNKQQTRTFREQLHKWLVQGFPVEEFTLDYGNGLEMAIDQVVKTFDNKNNTRALALRALGQDPLVVNALDDNQRQVVLRQNAVLEIDVDFQVANVKYTFLNQVCQLVRKDKGKLSRNTTQMIDNLVLNKWIGIPFFFFVMYLMFMFSINIDSAFIDFFDIGVGTLLVDGGHYLLDDHLPVWLVTLLADGVGGGIQTVATFIPVIACLYL